MTDLLWLIPALPLLSGAILILGSEKLPAWLVAALGVGSVGLSALCVLATAWAWEGQPVTQQLWTWMRVGDFSAGVRPST